MKRLSKLLLLHLVLLLLILLSGCATEYHPYDLHPAQTEEDFIKNYQTGRGDIGMPTYYRY